MKTRERRVVNWNRVESVRCRSNCFGIPRPLTEQLPGIVIQMSHQFTFSLVFFDKPFCPMIDKIKEQLVGVVYTGRSKCVQGVD